MASYNFPGSAVMSDLLAIREKGVLLSLLEPHCKLIKTTVAQVLQSREGECPGWSRLDCGVVCLVEDESVSSHFLRLYCIKRAKLLWEHELYIPFRYTAKCAFFHTFPADDHYVGLNFANKIEAEEFQLAVDAVHEKMACLIEANTETVDRSTSDPCDLDEPEDDLDEEKHFAVDSPSATVSPTTSCFKELDPVMRKLLIQARLTEEDLKNKDIAEAVDCIINRYGGLHAVQRELRKAGPVSQTLPRAAGKSFYKAQPLPPVPSIKDRTTFEQTTQGTVAPDERKDSAYIVTSPSPAVTDRITRSTSFKQVGIPTARENGDLILAALKEVFRKKQMLEQSTYQEES
ncbi:neural Wiskott-Aldrich syndrome protein [Mugil cephalus]|uniref:neural Wiskott-Aldrich syndrome protein n=1 Tax=Mugil cephalus TaxID=48193 RepID=UPI001FB64452|nr:neural Wiskott-Aldrich syndrome protein [Mugil cephalus]